MDTKMKTAVMNRQQEMEIVRMPIPDIKAQEVLIRVKAVGVCGSDLHYYAEGKIGDVEVEMPFILGHEVSGVIEKIGSEVKGFALGDRVAVEAGIPCGVCEFCRTGRYNICPDMHFLATPPINGALSEYIAYPAEWVFKLPDTISEVEGALIEPLAVGMQAAEIANASLGESAFIFGCGCIGLVTLLSLKSRGVSNIYMCDIIPYRIEKAYELGATRVFHAGNENVVEEILKLTNDRGVDSVFEMTGSKSSLQQTVELVRKGGVLVLVGLGSESVMDFDFGKLIWKEGQIRTCFRYKNIYPKAIQAISSGMIDVKQLVSDTVKIDDVPQAFRYHLDNKANIIKMVVEF